MKIRSFIVVLIAINSLMLASAGLVLAEKLTPTNNKVAAKEEKEFSDAMSVWYSHRYDEGAKLLANFAEKNPNSRWAAEACCFGKPFSRNGPPGALTPRIKPLPCPHFLHDLR